MPSKGGRPTSARGEAGPPRQPEKKFGPYAGGVAVLVWLNTVETADGPRKFRSIGIAPRRYFSREHQEWRDAKSYRTSDIPAIAFGLQQAQEYILTTPIPGDRRPASRQDDPPY